MFTKRYTVRMVRYKNMTRVHAHETMGWTCQGSSICKSIAYVPQYGCRIRSVTALLTILDHSYSVSSYLHMLFPGICSES